MAFKALPHCRRREDSHARGTPKKCWLKMNREETTTQPCQELNSAFATGETEFFAAVPDLFVADAKKHRRILFLLSPAFR